MPKILASDIIKQVTKKPFIQPNIGAGYPSELAKQKVDIDLVIKAYISYLLTEVNNHNENAVDALLTLSTINIQNTVSEIKGDYESLNTLIKSGSKQSDTSSPTVGAPGPGGMGGQQTPADLAEGAQDDTGISVPGKQEATDWWDQVSNKGEEAANSDLGVDPLGSMAPWLAIANAGTSGEAASTLMASCIPCGLRIEDFKEWEPFQDIMDTLMSWLNDIKKQLRDFLNLFKMTDMHDTICYLLGFLNFICIPDLAALIALLNFLILDIINAIAALSIQGGLLALWGLLAPLFTPFLVGIEAIIEQWIKTLLAPIDCIIDSILLQLNSLKQVGREMQMSVPLRYKKATLPSGSSGGRGISFYYPDPTPTNMLGGATVVEGMDTAIDAIEGVSDMVHEALSGALIYVYHGRDRILQEWNKVRDMLIEFLELDLDGYSLMAELSATIKRIMRLVSIIGFVIDIATEGLHCNPQEHWGKEGMDGALDDFSTSMLGGKPFSSESVTKKDVTQVSSVIITVDDNIVILPYDDNIILDNEVPVINQYKNLLSNKSSALWGVGKVVSLDECLKTNAQNFGKINSLMKEIQQQGKEIGL